METTDRVALQSRATAQVRKLRRANRAAWRRLRSPALSARGPRGPCGESGQGRRRKHGARGPGSEPARTGLGVGRPTRTAGNRSAVFAVAACLLALLAGSDAEAQDVGEPRVDPGVAGKEKLFTLSIKVRHCCSQTAVTLRYYRSSDSTISASDTEVATEATSLWNNFDVRTFSTELMAPASTGTYYYGACVDPSSSRYRCTYGVPVIVAGPDLLVESPLVSPLTLGPSGSFDFSATLRNQGPSAADSTTLRFERQASTAANWTEEGAIAVGSLDASETGTYTIALTAPMRPGSYAYRACVDDVTDESSRQNNCTGSVPVTVVGPDLVVESPGVSNDRVGTGRSFTFSATVRNRGFAAAEPTSLRYEHWDDAFETWTRVGESAVDSLGASATSVESLVLTAPEKLAGTAWYRACADKVADEDLFAGNNCSETVSVTVVGPDLVVESPLASASVVTKGQGFRLSATLRNQSIGTAAEVTVRWYRSRNSTISASDVAVDASGVGSLVAGGTLAASIGLTALASPGYSYYGACVEGVPAEASTRNNCSAGVRIRILPAYCTIGLGTVSGTVSAPGSWTRDCPSVHRARRYARYYSFTLSGTATVTIDLESSADSFLFLLGAAGLGGAILASDDDGGDGTDARIVHGLGPGTYTIEATTVQSYATGRFTLTLTPRARRRFTDEQLFPGETVMKAVHVTELRTRIDELRLRQGLPAFQWTDPILTARVTPIKHVHVTQLRAALTAAYDAAGRPPPNWTDRQVTPEVTVIRAAHISELRIAIVNLEGAR